MASKSLKDEWIKQNAEIVAHIVQTETKLAILRTLEFKPEKHRRSKLEQLPTELLKTQAEMQVLRVEVAKLSVEIEKLSAQFNECRASSSNHGTHSDLSYPRLSSRIRST